MGQVLGIQHPLCIQKMGINTKVSLTSPEKLAAHKKESQCLNNTEYLLSACCKVTWFE